MWAAEHTSARIWRSVGLGGVLGLLHLALIVLAPLLGPVAVQLRRHKVLVQSVVDVMDVLWRTNFLCQALVNADARLVAHAKELEEAVLQRRGVSFSETICDNLCIYNFIKFNLDQMNRRMRCHRFSASHFITQYMIAGPARGSPGTP